MKDLVFRYLLVLFITIVSAASLYGQIIPAEGSKLNYRLAGLSVPSLPGIKTYRFEIAEGYHTSPEVFSRQEMIVENTKENLIITKLPRFGQRYTWRVAYTGKGNSIKTSPLYHFETGTLPLVDTMRYRLRIIDSAKAYKDMLVILDSRVIYDMTGSPVWYLPNITGVLDDATVTRDLKPTRFGTFTFLKDNRAFEVNYNGEIIWEVPQAAVRPDSQANYHHDFTRLSNGNYMIADQEDIAVTSSTGDTSTLKLGTLVEFDRSKKVIWHWRSGNYYLNSDKYRELNGQSSHLNAFYFDERKKVIYVSFRNTNTIQKISYPSGKLMASYDGDKDSLFKAQHHCRINKKGQMYLFNNNVNKGPGTQYQKPSSVMKLKFSKDNTLREEWEYTCDIDSQARHVSPGGGSVYQLENGDILCGMGVTSRIFIVSRDKKILWNAVAEWGNSGAWIPYPQYRTAYISNSSELRKFIFCELKLR